MDQKKGQSKHFWTLSRKFIVAHLGHILVLGVLLGWGAYRIVPRPAPEDKPLNLKAVAQSVAEICENETRAMGLLVTNMIGNAPSFNDNSSNNLTALKRHLHQYADKFPQIVFFDENGNKVFRFSEGHSGDTLPDSLPRDFPAGDGMEPNRVQVFTPSRISRPDLPIIQVVYRHIDLLHGILGTVVADVSPEYLSNVIRSGVKTGKSTVAVIDNHGHILFSTEQSRPPGLAEELESLLSVDDAPLVQHRLFGKDSFVARRRIAALNWTVLVAQPEDIYSADMKKLTWGIALVLTAFVGGSILLGVYIARGIVRPVLVLNEKISQAAGSQDLAQRVHWKSRDEFGMLANSFNRMLLRLREAYAQMASSQKKISHLAFHDNLTNLPNRTMLIHSLESELAQADRDGGKLAVLSIGLDNFKLVNETMGQAIGDRVLCKVAERLQETVRINDFVCRHGGDEFVVFMVQYGETAGPAQNDEFISRVSSLAHRIVHKIKEPLLIEDYEAYMSTSIGISIFPDDADNAQSAVQKADSALCKAKDLGGGQIQFYVAEFTQSQKKRMDLATRLNKAIDKNEFVLLYQPVVNLTDGRIVGAEALIRWQTGQGTVAPDEFIPLAEEIGLIHPIGNWVINEACCQVRKWNDAGASIPSIAINLSARQFWHGDIAAQLQNAVENNRIRPESFELEITESSVMKDPLRMEAILTILDGLGFNLALDDFGTGYSSLLRLKRLPIAKLKIDRSFVEGIPRNADNLSLVNAIVQLSRNLGIHAQAEGIETAEQWLCLKDSGCEYGQGHFFSPPVTAREFEEMVRSGRRLVLGPGKGKYESGRELFMANGSAV